MDFSEYLKVKKIDPAAFKKGASDQFDELKNVFDQMHPDNFTQQKLFLINPLRRKYKWQEQKEEKKAEPAAMRPNPDNYREAKPKI